MFKFANCLFTRPGRFRKVTELSTIALDFPRLPSRLRDFSEGSLAGEGCVGARAMKCPTAQDHQRLLLAVAQWDGG